MNWDLLFNIIKVAGACGGIIAAIVMGGRFWSGSSRENLLKHMQSELELSREHVKAADRTVLHYRDEMHDVRKECNGEVTKARNQVEEMQEKLKTVEIENASLLAKTDLSPVMTFMNEQREFVKEQREFVKEQTDINAEVLKNLRYISEKNGNT